MTQRPQGANHLGCFILACLIVLFWGFLFVLIWSFWGEIIWHTLLEPIWKLIQQVFNFGEGGSQA